MNIPFIKKYLQKWHNKLTKKSKEKATHESGADTETKPVQPEDYHTVIGRMAAFFAHEIRNPLTTIIGFSQFLEQDPHIKSEPHISQYISIIKEEAIRMESLIQELLTLSKSHLNQDNLSIIDVKSSVEKIVAIYSMQTQNDNIRFITSLADEVYITGNTVRFERLLINLVKNAVEAIKNDGTIEVSVAKENDTVLLSIIDSGPGFAPDQLEQVFYPFFTTKETGTGLGLPICKAITETLGGTITIENHPTKGAHVKMEFPLSRQVANKS
ncbi:signal transduction histidine kinase [Caldalkalibacillus uzonensis]|uniref:histidine kinase n=1 Tax=Caldalkalibacillus uzonensis TaxID=353224 RepID=A0ABU0CUJ7_9BACI|nr:HAMP domain-containing sensor histidine kinase [Caldalkalibacillus uzonensis]MDQ0340089.1 signal transduction histidine kinase [Caldalkalibacillus uzonensis]